MGISPSKTLLKKDFVILDNGYNIHEELCNIYEQPITLSKQRKKVSRVTDTQKSDILPTSVFDRTSVVDKVYTFCMVMKRNGCFLSAKRKDQEYIFANVFLNKMDDNGILSYESPNVTIRGLSCRIFLRIKRGNERAVPYYAEVELFSTENNPGRSKGVSYMEIRKSMLTEKKIVFIRKKS